MNNSEMALLPDERCDVLVVGGGSLTVLALALNTADGISVIARHGEL